ncbi:putative glycophosphotransferase [Tieghemostelium lacteum]|uniref:Putative glycophosphotransferase n=1 Tax=Tieghemostelium lacteum TaxID=361077 RepID=A0A152AA46_TIELA|nr:putative glycophosphotransferase [Tieghemostelium lacteum]|eukprot:KYR03001.1 putative glycophosphotransferase [Tieghemostelium lacteum]
MKSLYYLFLFYNVFIITLGQQDIIYQNQLPFGLWNNVQSWDPQIIPGIQDAAIFQTTGDTCVADSNVIVGYIYIGSSTTTNTSLEIRASLSASEVSVYSTGTLKFNSTLPTSTVSLLGALYVFGSAYNYHNLYITAGSVVGIGGYFETMPGSYLRFNPPTIITNIGVIVVTEATTHFHGIQINGTVLYSNSKNNILDRIDPSVGSLDVILSLDSGLQYTNSTVNTTANYFLLYDTSSLILTQGSVFKYFYPEFGTTNLTFARWFMDHNSLAYIEDSTLILQGVKINTWQTSKIYVNGSTLNTDYYIFLYESSELNLFRNSNLTVTGYLAFGDESKLNSMDSSITVIDGLFAMYDQSKLVMTSSKLTIQVQNPEAGSIIGVLGTSILVVSHYSLFNLDSIFVISTQGVVYASNNSKITVTKELFIGESGRMLLETGASISINANVEVAGNGSFHTDHSEVFVNKNLILKDQADFWFIDSTVKVSGSLLTIAQNYTSLITRSKFSVDGNFSSFGEIQILDSEIIVSQHFYTAFKMKCNGSRTFIESGDLFIYGEFESHNSSFTATNGNLQVSSLSIFKCFNCQIDIKAGSFIQGYLSDVTIVNSTFINSGGTVQSSSPLKLTQSGITNKGQFILKSDITTDDTTNSFLVENQGDFTINGENSTTINLRFNNNGGNLNINQNSNFGDLKQVNGTISLQNSTLSSIQVINIYAGSLQGNGQINGQVVNNGNLGDSEKVNIIIINGNLTQSESSSTVAYVTDSENSHFNISENVSLNGTLKIRIEDTVSDTNQTKQIITSQSSNNSQFKKIEVVYYNKETKTEYPPCKPIETEQTEKGLAVLLKSGNPPNQGCEDSKSKKSITVPLTVGLVVGVVGLSVIIAAVFVFKKKLGTRLFVKSIGNKLKRITTKH